MQIYPYCTSKTIKITINRGQVVCLIVFLRYITTFNKLARLQTVDLPVPGDDFMCER